MQKNIRSDGVRPEGYNNYYKIAAMWFDPRGNVQNHKSTQFMNRADAISLLKKKLKQSNVISVTISLENEFVAEQHKTFEGPAYTIYYSEYK